MERIFLFIICLIISANSFAGPHTLRPGEKLADVAKLYHISLDSLQKANPGIKENTGIVVDIPVDYHFFDLSNNLLFRQLSLSSPKNLQKGRSYYAKGEKALKKYWSNNERSRASRINKAIKHFQRALEYGDTRALRQLGLYFVQENPNRWYDEANFEMPFNPDSILLRKGIEFLQINIILEQDLKSVTGMAYIFGHERSSIRNPHLCEAILEKLHNSEPSEAEPMLCYMYENGYGVMPNYLKAYMYCNDKRFIYSFYKNPVDREKYGNSHRGKILQLIEKLPEGTEFSTYGGGLDNSLLVSIGLSKRKDNLYTSESMFWIHRAAHLGDADANWLLASILKNDEVEGFDRNITNWGSTRGKEELEFEAFRFAEAAAYFGNEDAKAYVEYQNKRKEEERLAKYRAEEARKQARRERVRQIVGGIVQVVAESAAIAMNQTMQNQYMSQLGGGYVMPTSTSMLQMSNNQIYAQNALALNQLAQYTTNSVNAQFYGTPMISTDMSAVNLGTDMSPGSPLWNWQQQQRINAMENQTAMARCEVLSFYRAQTEAARQNLFNSSTATIQQPQFDFTIYDNTPNMSFTLNESTPMYSGSTMPVVPYQSEHRDYEAEKRDVLNRTVGENCTLCKGDGKCTACHGSKIVNSMGLTYTCTTCDQNGNCGVCKGTGKTSWNR